jgi:hypothetical protein
MSLQRGFAELPPSGRLTGGSTRAKASLAGDIGPEAYGPLPLHFQKLPSSAMAAINALICAVARASPSPRFCRRPGAVADRWGLELKGLL